MGEFNILPLVGKNKMTEVYVVGQLHVDLFELTELPDMALSNRQGYKSDDLRYQKVLEYVRNELLPLVLRMRGIYSDLKKADKKEKELEKGKAAEHKYTGPKKLDPKSNDWRSVFLWLNIASNSKKRLLMLI